jgi:hypothetical protein
MTALSIGTGGSCSKPNTRHKKWSVFEVITRVHDSPLTSKSHDCWMEEVFVID